MVRAHDVIAIGASAGGVDALRSLVATLPTGMPASLFVAIHIGRNESLLPEILTRAGNLPALFPADGDEIETGRIYVAPPDHHLLVGHDHVHLSRGPKENRTRPAINPMFRTAAQSYGERTVGVILTGALDDGVSGLWEIKQRGGVTVVQDPKDALYPSMPYNAIENVPIDHVVKLSGLGELLTTLATTEACGREREKPGETVKITSTDLTCPECRGPLHEERRGRIVDYRCRVGHAYSPQSLMTDHQETQERALWAATVALEEGADIADGLAAVLGERYAEEAQQKREQAAVIKQMLTECRH